MIEDKKSKLIEQLDALKIFPKNKLVRQLQKQIKTKLERLDKQESKIPTKQDVAISSNKSRSGKLKRYHNYIRQIRNNFSDLSYSQIRSQFARRKRGEDVSIPDAIFQNPSP